MDNYIHMLPYDVIDNIIEDILDEHEKTIEKIENINRKIHRKIYGSFDVDKGLIINKTNDGYIISFGNIKYKYTSSNVTALLLLASYIKYNNKEYRILPYLFSSSYLLYKFDSRGIKKYIDHYGFLRPIKLVYYRNYTYGNSNIYITEKYNSVNGLDILRETAESIAITCFYNKNVIEYLKKIVKDTREYYDIFIENDIMMEDDIDYYLVCLKYNNNIGVD